MATGAFGQRLAMYRRRRGLSQAALAGLIGRSESWLSQVERGLRTVDRWSVLTELAVVLRVPVEALIGSATPAVSGTPAPEGLDVIRRFFTSHEALSTDSRDGAGPQPGLANRIRTAHADYQAARYDVLIEGLPALLADAETGRSVDRDGLTHVVWAYVVAAKLLTKVGLHDLALLAADRSAMAATGSPSLDGRGAAAYQVACALARSGRSAEAEELAVRMAEQVQRHGRSSEPTLISVAGSLWLIAAVIAAQRHDRAETVQRLDNAQRLAELLGKDSNHAWTAFGTANVGIHRVSVAAGMGDAGLAVREAARIDVDKLPAGLISRRVQVHLDLAGAYVQRRNPADALLNLLEAERVSRQAVRYNAAAQQLIRNLLARTTQSTSPVLQSLAVRAGVLN